MSTGLHFGALPALLLAVLLAVAPSPVLAAGVVTGGTADDGYVASAFEKLGRHWSPPPGLHGDFKVQVEVLVDGHGDIAGCKTRQSSGMDAFDAAACGAVEQAGNLGVPPGGKPLTLYCTFQSQRERERRPDPDEELQKDIRARMEAQNRFSTQRAGWAEEDARYKAEKAARAQGQTFEGYDFVPGQNLPGAREILDRPVRVQPGPQHPAAGAGRSDSATDATAARPAPGAAAGSPASRAGEDSSLPEDEADLAVAPGRHPSQEKPEDAREVTPQAQGAKAAPAPVRMVTLGDISAGIAVRRKASTGAPVQAPARSAVPSGSAAGGKAPKKSAGGPAGKAKGRPAAQEKAQASGAPSDTPGAADTMPVVRQDASDGPASPERKEAEALSAPRSARQPRAVQSQPGKASFPSPARQPSKVAPDGDASKTPSAQASSQPVPADAAAGPLGGMQEATRPVPAAAGTASVPDGRTATPQEAGVTPVKPATPSRPSADGPVPSSPSGEVRGAVVYPPEYSSETK
ncbi:MAG: TonB C-terminal domain-containing protein [Desulfovibrio sp.]|nr:TonB C-terminal domain-containing protein [Desulfovibrio sp.]